ncbi:MAG: hypothetical protein KDE56_17305 [Anaerolineales bacterium]|nr:hypothetical protein [Anaerolineales bacterium]
MGFLKRLFGGGEQKSSAQYVDKQGIYFYVQCDNCGSVVRVRADKQHDLQNTGDGFTWHKTIVDSRCFRRMQTVVQLNSSYAVVSAELQGGKYITEAEYKQILAAQDAARAQAADAGK